MAILQVVQDDVVVNIIVVGSDAEISSDRKLATWDNDKYVAQKDEFLWMVEGAQIGWTVDHKTLIPVAEPEQ